MTNCPVYRNLHAMAVLRTYVKTSPLTLIFLAIQCVAAATAHETPENAAQPVRLFILAGQSNMVGLNPEVSFTPAIKAAFPDDRIIVVKDAYGGQPIRRWYKDWQPASGNRPRGEADLYDQLLGNVLREIEGSTPDTIVFAWMQGERDAREDHGDVYANSLMGLVKQLETDLNHKDIFVVLGRLSDHDNDCPDRPHWNLVRQIQVDLAQNNSRWACVDTDDLNGPDNNLHYTRDGYVRLGKRFARSAIELIQPKNNASDENEKNR